MAFVRVRFRGTPFTLDDHFELPGQASRESLRFRLADQPVYAAAARLASRLGDAKKIKMKGGTSRQTEPSHLRCSKGLATRTPKSVPRVNAK